MTTAVRTLAYGCAADHYDEYIKIGESTAIKCLKVFCNYIVTVYAEEYMRPLNEADITRLLEEGEQRGFPDMLGSIDCMHWEWKNCPVEWHGTHRGRSVFNGIVNGQLPLVNYVVNGHHYRMGYYMSDGIYPKWIILMQTISHPSTGKEKLFAQQQEACMKDVERTFGVLQIKWVITRRPVRYWEKDDLRLIMKMYIIFHNMIIEHERHANVGRWTPPPEDAIPIPTLSRCPSVLAAHVLYCQLRIRNRKTNTRLMKNLWNRYGDEDI
ncbi:uncharacterized protein LOC132301205 [Cornus florida]|uniref:uncharacterized protein LOC132301205 n=1 Tax=Cornus florida TaxID=4283 RepID=UPI0028A2BCCB|nr:uncharacterized protein LOC132301205 [Cornus florida]